VAGEGDQQKEGEERRDGEREQQQQEGVVRQATRMRQRKA